MNCTTEVQLVSPEVKSTEDVVAPVAILEKHLGMNYQQYYASFTQPTNDISLLQTPAGWGSVPGPYAYNGVGLSNSPASLMPYGFCLPGYLPASDTTRPLACDCEVGQDVCSSQTDFGYHDGEMGGHLTTSHNETAAVTNIHHQQHQLQQPSWVTHQPPRLDAFDWRSYEDDSCECSADQTECLPITVSSSPSPSSLSSPNDAMMAATSASTPQCTDPVSESLGMMLNTQSSSTKHSEEDDRDGVFSPDSSRRLSPLRGIASPSPVSVRPDQGGPLTVQIRLQEASIESSFDDGDDESSPSPGFDRRRGSLGSRPPGAGGVGDGVGAFSPGSRLGVVLDGAANGLPSQARRSSIACIPARVKGLGTGDLQRPSAALDYESLKVKLEKLTGPVTEGTRKDGSLGASRALRERRRTSIAVFPPPPPYGYPTTGGPTVSDDQKTNETMMTMAKDNILSSADNDPHPVVHAVMSDTTGTVNITVTDGSQLHHRISPNHLQESTNSLEPYDKNLSDDLTSSSSSSSSSSSKTPSSCLLKFRLNCVIEQILQNDARLKEIVRRHESERQNVRRKHRSQWMELEKSLTRNFGEEWKKFATVIPELSLASTSSDGNISNDLHGDFTDARHQKDEAVLNNQNITEQPLETISEGLIEDSFVEVSTDSSLDQRRLSLMSCDYAKPAAGSSSEYQGSRRYSEGNMSSERVMKTRPFRRVAKQHETPNIVQNNGEFIETRPCSNNTPNRQCPVGIPVPNSSRLHRYATDTTTSKTLNNTEDSRVYGLLQPVQNHQSCLQANIAARLSQMYTQNALQALLTANLLDANSHVYGFDPGMDPTGYGLNSLLPMGRPTYAVQELDQQVLAFPWTAPYQNQNIHSLQGLHHYEGYI